MFKHILVPTDGSELSKRAAAAAIEQARATGARLTVLHAMPPATPLVFGEMLPVAYMPPDEHENLVNRAADIYLGDVKAQADAAGVECHTVKLVSDFPAQTIVDTAKTRHCDAIWMASHGRRGMAAILLGSETQKVLAHTDLPVVVFR
jgi:nucleotide-binding universal stress UspA family protein